MEEVRIQLEWGERERVCSLFSERCSIVGGYKVGVFCLIHEKVCVCVCV